jgi:hypothetical protein
MRWLVTCSRHQGVLLNLGIGNGMGPFRPFGVAASRIRQVGAQGNREASAAFVVNDATTKKHYRNITTRENFSRAAKCV